MDSGRRDRQVYVDRPVDTSDAIGGSTRTWVQVGGIWWVSIEPLTGREFANGTAILGVMDTRITFGWSLSLEQLDERWRIRYRSKVYNVVSVVDKKMGHVDIECMCLLGKNQG